MIIVVDIDGTIADCSHRLHYIQGPDRDSDAFYDAVDKDEPIEDMIKFLRILYYTDVEGVEFIFITGRRESCRRKTEKWLSKYIAGYPAPLLMRKEGDKRPDTEVKPELLFEFQERMLELGSDWTVDMIFEDRTSMVNKWRELGYRCLQVKDGNY